MQISPQQAAVELLQRREARHKFVQWCRLCGWEPAKHHLLVIEELQKAVDKYKNEGLGTNLMILMPPGSAKSTYTSKLFPPWYLAQMPNLAILACSHSAELANDFGRAGRNLVETHNKILGYELSKDSRAADSWEITNGGYYRAAGCGAGISGRRADLGLIDDFCGTEEDAGSKTFNNKIYNWWLNDLVPRLKPNAIRIIIANHRNEDDLVGRLMAKESAKWKIIRLRLLIETEIQASEDPLGRQVGDWLWPEFFTKEMVLERMANPGSSGLEQQEPSSADGELFKAENIDEAGYKSLNDLAGGTPYGASDHAISEEQQGDPSCLGLGFWKDGFLYIHPDLAWDKMGSEKQIAEWLTLGMKYNPVMWRAEKGQVSKSLYPFLALKQKEKNAFFAVSQYTPSKDKVSRAQTAIGMSKLGLIRLPMFAPWFKRARAELLKFPNGSHDDFVDFLAHLCNLVHGMSYTAKKEVPVAPVEETGFNITPRILKAQTNKDKRQLRIAMLN